MSEDWKKELNLDTDGLDEAREANKEQAESSTPTKKKQDERFWKPRLKDDEGKERSEYEALIRILPPSTEWLSNRTLPWSQKVFTHYVKDVNNPKIGFTVRCRKTLGRDEYCPICDYNWSVWRKAKADGDKFTQGIMAKRGDTPSFIGNVLIVDDVTCPKFNEEIKLWDHTPRMNDWLNAPMRPAKSKEENKDDKKRSYQEDEVSESFNAIHPLDGRNFLVVVKAADKKGEPIKYESSKYLSKSSPIANSKDELISMLERCYSLDEFVKDIPSVDDLRLKYQEFNDKVSDAGGVVPMADSIQQSVPDMSKLSPGVHKNDIDQGDATEIFKDDAKPETKSEEKKEAPKAETKKEDVKTEAATVAADSSSQEDDLPF